MSIWDYNKHDWTQYGWGWLSVKKCKAATSTLNLMRMLAKLDIKEAGWINDIQIIPFMERMYETIK
jgi:hypothetical protein